MTTHAASLPSTISALRHPRDEQEVEGPALPLPGDRAGTPDQDRAHEPAMDRDAPPQDLVGDPRHRLACRAAPSPPSSTRPRTSPRPSRTRSPTKARRSACSLPALPRGGHHLAAKDRYDGQGSGLLGGHSSDVPRPYHNCPINATTDDRRLPFAASLARIDVVRPGPEALDAILKRCGIVLDRGQLDQLWRYHRMLRAANAG